MKIFSVTILSEAERLQIKCLSPKGEFLICSEERPFLVSHVI